MTHVAAMIENHVHVLVIPRRVDFPTAEYFRKHVSFLFDNFLLELPQRQGLTSPIDRQRLRVFIESLLLGTRSYDDYIEHLMEGAMNRRRFFSTLAKVTAGFTILPAATTYERIWRVQRGPVIPVWYNRLPFWYAVNYAAMDAELTRKFYENWRDILSNPFFPNMGDLK